MRRYDVIFGNLRQHVGSSAGRPYQNDHEDANGQFEMNWEYDTALVTATATLFFKYMVKSIAEKKRTDARLSCPSPSPISPGTAAISHVSLWKNGK